MPSRYQTNVMLVEYHSGAILGDQFRVYQGVYQRYQQDPDNVAFNDVVTAQQTLAQVITTYVQALGDQWQAVIDLASVLQAPDMFNMGDCNQPNGLAPQPAGGPQGQAGSQVIEFLPPPQPHGESRPTSPGNVPGTCPFAAGSAVGPPWRLTSRQRTCRIRSTCRTTPARWRRPAFCGP